MSEVFTFSGSAGAFGAVSCPAGWTATPNGNCGGPAPSYRAPAAAALQNALNALGKTIGDTSLKLTVDGVVGPATVQAVNRALTTHVGSGQAPAALRTGQLDISTVAQNAVQLTGLITAEVGRRGGAVAPLPAAAAPTASTAPATAPMPAPLAPSAAGELSTKAAWSLVGLNLLATAAGAYGMLTRK